MTRAKPKPSDDVVAPARITESHVQDRSYLKEIQEGTRTKVVIAHGSAWRALSVLDKAHRRGQLLDRDLCTTEEATKLEVERALDRYEAGQEFGKHWEKRQGGTKDSLDLSRGGSSGASGSISDAQIAAGQLLAGWEAHMGRNDWMICRRVCGEDYAIAITVADISPSYRDSSLARAREALDSLVNARHEARKCQWCRRNKPHGAALEA